MGWDIICIQQKPLQHLPWVTLVSFKRGFTVEMRLVHVHGKAKPGLKGINAGGKF